ncbi:P-loop containing nucleoside triphosphate hydrolase protein [Aspergillus pseudonomiae]|uniref:P-loop containing nucleoside triphosphate hydrolase protein n=1 Tax=Aspergillus pseudonomiae TaxID=1506151 RepID=A0A5N7DTR2_9EURO|nr:P-loop containing nucleoside triphosphate hydrolase protein [Aspergillus pseudonomiae]KAE8409861.1 P-loop containing nucleoside triphosphate hydrolase protein [Aspergillus pseudonomiae]
MASSQVDMSSEEHMQTVLERQLNGLRSDDRGRLKIVTYATKLDRTILCFSSVCAIIAGALNPLVPVIYGLLVGVFNGFATGSVDAAELRSKISTFSLYYVYLSIGLFVFTYLATVGFYYSGERITRAFRIAYLSAIIRQNMAFFDVLRLGEISNRIMSDMGILQEAITSKASTMLSAIATFCAAFIIAFVMYWKTALILTPFFIAMLLMFSVGGAYTVRHQKQSREKYSYAAGIPEEAFGAIRQVAAFGMQNFVRQRYSLSLGQAARAERKAQNMVAGLVASMNAMPCLIYALSFWAGSIFLVKGEMSVTDITTTTLAVTIGVFAIIRIAPSLQALTSGVAITGSLLETIARRSPQDPLVADGDKLTNVVGDILFDQVDLVYPSRSQAKVLDRVTLKFAADKKTAIVGPSGGGKSSIIGLIERFYEPTHGAITIDGQDIQAFNLRWLRQQIGLVDQDPILLDVSILDNIYYSCSNVNDAASESARLEKVVDAAKKAYAHDFIMALPEGYQTRVGEKGLQLSGGQRQRIAIARALVRDPKILLLDEATSALDTSSEKAVQAAIDAAAEQRTTVVIAHRLSTIKNADSIVVLAQGKVVDQGTHVELMARNGLYADLIEKQQIKENGQDASSSLHTCDEGIIMLNDSLDHGSNSDDEKNGASVTARVVEAPNDTSYNPSARGALSFIFFMSRPDWKLLLIGLACAILAGLEIPVQSIFFAKLLTITGLPQAQYSQLRHGVNLWTGLYVALAGAGFILWLGLGITLSYATQKLSQRVREICCHRITVQNMAFFDQSKNSPSALSSVLSKSTDDLAGMGGPVLGGILTFISTIVGGIVVSLAIGWKLALVCTATIPVVVACGWLRLQVLAAFDARIRQSGVDSAAYAGQIVRSMRTVASLGLEEQALMLYDGFLAKRAAKSLQSILIASGLYAASQSVVYLCAALAFWYGGTLIANREYSDFQVYVCFVCLISGSQIAGSIFTFAPDAGKAMHAAQDLQYIVELNDPGNEVQWRPAESGILEHKRTEHELLHGLEPCQVAFKNVSFSYPSRPDKCALDNFTITVEPGQTLALVGQSGSGKSTCLSLLARFYPFHQGQILVDGHDIRSLDLKTYRSTISLISQEPVVFSGTMRENIAVGLVGQVSDDDILAACRQANILDFVHSLPDGLSSIVGTGGSMLSGGQKQRITIARAFLRKSKLLLLDEATSALDSESEAIVQAAIDAVKKNRTTIMVAHRLSTVMNADIICVMREGSIVEIGNSKQLMARRGLFWEMVGMQSLD